MLGLKDWFRAFDDCVGRAAAEGDLPGGLGTPEARRKMYVGPSNSRERARETERECKCA